MSLITDVENLSVISYERSLLTSLEKKEIERLRKRKWRLANSERVKETNRKWIAANPEKVKVNAHKYYVANPEKKRNKDNIRRARKLANGVYQISAKELKKLYNSPCLYCGSNNLIQADHVIPISRGGTHGIGNLVPACQKCNFSKGRKFLTEWKRIKT
jgi:5-methylcytosine-specific restriction endonuclease McrA